MALCPTQAQLTLSSVSMGLLVAFLIGLVAHGILKPLLEARGVNPWTLRDTLGATPLVLIGGALVGGGATVLTIAGATGCTLLGVVTFAVSVKMVIGLGMLRLGLLALRKLV